MKSAMRHARPLVRFVMLAVLAGGAALGCSPNKRQTVVIRVHESAGPAAGLADYVRAWDPQASFRDSLVLTLEPGRPIRDQRVHTGVRDLFSVVDGMSLGSKAPDGRIWLRTHGAFSVANPRGHVENEARPDSILVDSEPVLLKTWTTHSSTFIAVRVRRDGAPIEDLRRRVRVRGVVLSKWTGQPLQSIPANALAATGSAVVTVAYGDTFAVADSAGVFELQGVPEGRLRLHALGLRTPRPFGSYVITAPAESVVVLVDDDELGPDFWIAPPALALEVLPSGEVVDRLPDPRTVPGTLDWLAGRWEGELRVLPRSAGGAGRTIAVRCEFGSPDKDGRVGLVIRAAASPSKDILMQQSIRKRPGPHGPLGDLYDAVGTQWRYRAVGDSLLGLELDAPEGNPIQRLHVHRVAEPARVH